MQCVYFLFYIFINSFLNIYLFNLYNYIIYYIFHYFIKTHISSHFPFYNIFSDIIVHFYIFYKNDNAVFYCSRIKEYIYAYMKYKVAIEFPSIVIV
ncbi:hypothetical protein [Plasmodium yoelii yoelii]|uniref:Uncharacterized protein n=1 Tax=Plasmodium yoelii yoelii TaxID=73239 RepID=Q7RCR4_PLAYO|nr:hypothetical protein [Plasmodium yoelii yoelii]